MLLYLSQLPSCRAREKESRDRIADESEMENRISAEQQNTDLENLREFLLGHLKVTVPPAKPLMPPKSETKVSFNVTLISIPKKEVDLQQEETEEVNNEMEEEEGEEDDDREKEEEENEEEERGEEDREEEKEQEDLIEEEEREKEEVEEKKKKKKQKQKMKKVKSNENMVTEAVGTAQTPTTIPADDNLSYILSRLSGIESAIHRLNVQFYGLDVKVSQMYQSLSKMRNKLSEADDAITTVSEMNLRNQRQIGQIEGCLKGKRYTRKCYLIFQHFEDYDTAQKHCYSRGGNLAMPIDQQEFTAVAQYVHDVFYPFNWPVWIGINDRRSDGMYMFENGHRVSYYNWFKDPLVTEPNGGVLENCVSISSNDGKWWDSDCSRRMYYLCEY